MSNVKKSGGRPAMRREFVVLNKLGIHARPAAMFVRVANKFSCSILVEKDGEQVKRARASWALMMLAAGRATKSSSIAKATTPIRPWPRSKPYQTQI